MSNRYVLGPTLPYTRHAAPATTPPGGGPVVPVLTPPKADVSVAFLGLGKDPAGNDTARLQIPAYDLTKCNKVVDLRVYLVPAGTAPPPDAASYLASTVPMVSDTDVATHQEGVEVDMTLPAVPAGPNNTDQAYLGQVLIGYDV